MKACIAESFALFHQFRCARRNASEMIGGGTLSLLLLCLQPASTYVSETPKELALSLPSSSSSGSSSSSSSSSSKRNFVSMGLHRSPGKAIDDRQLQRLRGNVRRGRQLLGNETETTPLFQGLGTHFSYIYVGTPPQRVSVIIDTGSHHTAFPCVGCQCGKHMDPLFDPKKSNTSETLTCSGKKRCYFSQAYSEGSSWHAYRVKDKLWAGGQSHTSLMSAADWSIDFQFGCEDSETGLFRTQHVDGIMGMSAAEDTLPHQLVAQKVTSTRVFALCFSLGGGIMTLGGVDTSIHTLPDEQIQFAKLIKSKGWFTVNLLDVYLRPATVASSTDGKSSSGSVSLGASVEILNGNNNNKGVIVDSGTTDTYLPSSVKKSFEDIFKKMTNGMTYSNNNLALKKAQYESLPTIIFKLEGMDNNPVEIECPPSSYAENLGGGKYAFRIYLTEAQGAVLGANFMNDQNVIFDIDQHRVGFAKANCKHDHDT